MLLKYWRSKLPFPGLWGWTKLMLFRKKFIKSSWSMEVTILQKLGQKMNRVTSLLHFLPNTFRTADVLVTSSFTLTKMSWTMLKNLYWFNPMSCIKISNTSTCIIHIHPCFSLVALFITFFPWKKKNELNHCYKKEKNMLYGALTELVLELE